MSRLQPYVTVSCYMHCTIDIHPCTVSTLCIIIPISRRKPYLFSYTVCSKVRTRAAVVQSAQAG